MKRLTRNGITVCGDKYYDALGFGAIEQRPFFEIIKKLAHYEDLEESGKIPILYIGDDIYFRVKGMNQFAEYVDFIQTQKISRIDIDQNGILYCTASVKFIESDIGKSIFLTREEADNKLKGINKNEEI